MNVQAMNKLRADRFDVRRKRADGLFELVKPGDVKPGDKLFRPPWTLWGRFRWVKLTRQQVALFVAGKWSEFDGR